MKLFIRTRVRFDIEKEVLCPSQELTNGSRFLLRNRSEGNLVQRTHWLPAKKHGSLQLSTWSHRAVSVYRIIGRSNLMNDRNIGFGLW